jgi:hypothetical protein
MKQNKRGFFSIFLILTAAVLLNSSCSMPSRFKQFLESADRIELITDADKRDGEIVYRGDMIKEHSLIATISDDATKKKIVRAVNLDAGGTGDTVCFLPRHILRAVKGEQVVEVEICYQCLRYEIKGSLGEYSGGLYFTSSESVLNDILLERGVQIE